MPIVSVIPPTLVRFLDPPREFYRLSLAKGLTHGQPDDIVHLSHIYEYTTI